MPFPIKTCVECGEEFELRPDKPGFANRCPRCSEPETEEQGNGSHQGNGIHKDEIERRNESEMNAERRKAIRDMLYRKES